ncbi:DUF2283 domain-containing protein [Nocardia puris]|nr:DUF2283 domain-containing protein [Nocardia puris]MBF6209898.1 DUF2283 domain-containing protein [Nocardia puris]MBF6366470.1 DUF2283 domain-containing protein [Nocardia puris]MBF6458191.1 DUF2283 domain-containing protein [Nocardia puris]
MRVTYDPAADAAYFTIADAIAPGEATRQVVTPVAGGTVVLDFNSSGTLLGLEVLGAQRLVPAEVLGRAEPPART